MSKVLVTGGSGFVGVHVILQLLNAGREVRTTVRNVNRESVVRAVLKAGGAEPGDRLSFFAADLESDKGWPEAVAGCDYVMHVASPIPPTAPQHEDEVIGPAREGTLRVLSAARDGQVKRVVADIARMVRSRLGASAKRVPRFELPDFLVRLAAKRDKSMQQLLPLLGKIRNATSAKAQRVLGWSPRSNEEAVVATAESLMRFGLLK